MQEREYMQGEQDAEACEIKPRLKDKERCAFGRGWESRRAGESLAANPFPDGTWQAQAWLDGYHTFKRPSLGVLA